MLPIGLDVGAGSGQGVAAANFETRLIGRRQRLNGPERRGDRHRRGEIQFVGQHRPAQVVRAGPQGQRTAIKAKRRRGVGRGQKDREIELRLIDVRLEAVRRVAILSIGRTVLGDHDAFYVFRCRVRRFLSARLAAEHAQSKRPVASTKYFRIGMLPLPPFSLCWAICCQHRDTACPSRIFFSQCRR